MTRYVLANPRVKRWATWAIYPRGDLQALLDNRSITQVKARYKSEAERKAEKQGFTGFAVEVLKPEQVTVLEGDNGMTK